MHHKTDIELFVGDLVKYNKKSLPYVNDRSMFDKVGIVIEVGKMYNEWNEDTFHWAKVQFSDGEVEEWMGYMKVIKRGSEEDNKKT